MIDFQTIFMVLLGSSYKWMFRLILVLAGGGNYSTKERLVDQDMPRQAQREGILGRDLIFRWVDKKQVRRTRSNEGYEVFHGYDDKARRRYRFVNRSGHVLMAKKIS
jgi:hypothetical protein